MVPMPMYIGPPVVGVERLLPRLRASAISRSRRGARAGDPSGGPGARALAPPQCVRVVAEEPETRVVAGGPFEVVHKRPGEVAAHAGGTVAPGVLQRAQVGEQVVAARRSSASARPFSVTYTGRR